MTLSFLEFFATANVTLPFGAMRSIEPGTSSFFGFASLTRLGTTSVGLHKPSRALFEIGADGLGLVGTAD